MLRKAARLRELVKDKLTCLSGTVPACRDATKDQMSLEVREFRKGTRTSTAKAQGSSALHIRPLNRAGDRVLHYGGPLLGRFPDEYVQVCIEGLGVSSLWTSSEAR